METGILFLELLNSVASDQLFIYYLYLLICKRRMIIIYLVGRFNGSLVYFQRRSWQLKQTSVHTQISSGQDLAAQLCWFLPQTAVSTSSAGKLRLVSRCPTFFALSASDFFVFRCIFFLPWNLFHCGLWPKKQQVHRLVITIGRWSCALCPNEFLNC